MNPQIPKSFAERYSKIVDDPERFFSCLMSHLPKSFRINTIKGPRELVLDRFQKYGIKVTPVPWYPDAFICDSLEIGSTLEHFLGWIYIQELTSMISPLVVREELKRAGFVLDACAAPGSKTTQLAALMNNRGTIVANDIDYGRIRALRFNLEKAGVLNTVITNQDLRYFPATEFDVILLDAPCSAEGTIRKNFGVLKIWNEQLVYRSSALQKQLVLKAFDMLKPGGVMVYSTCTFAPEENELVINHLLANRHAAKIESFDLPGLKTSSAINQWNHIEFDNQVQKCTRIWPHHNDTDGFFIARVRK